MWILRQYDSATDELIAEFELPALHAEEAERLLGFTPTPLGSTPLDAEQTAALARGAGVNESDSTEVASFLDFDDDAAPATPVARDTAPARRD